VYVCVCVCVVCVCVCVLCVCVWKERYEGICSGGLEGLSARVPMSPEGKVEGTMKGGLLWTQHTPSLQTTSLFEVGLVYFSFKGEHEHRAILPKWA